MEPIGGAGDRVRTGDVQLGRLTLYQLSYSREAAKSEGRNWEENEDGGECWI
jgi:hypothetical protein